jgi:hypothetical protein
MRKKLELFAASALLLSVSGLAWADGCGVSCREVGGGWWYCCGTGDCAGDCYYVDQNSPF